MTSITPEGQTMPDTIDLAAILALPAAKKLELIEVIHASIPEEDLPPRELSDELKAELDRRLQDMEDNPGDEVTLEEAMRRLAARRVS
jgi:putative addiction module component (TIGR02574 family)